MKENFYLHRNGPFGKSITSMLDYVSRLENVWLEEAVRDIIQNSSHDIESSDLC